MFVLRRVAPVPQVAAFGADNCHQYRSWHCARVSARYAIPDIHSAILAREDTPRVAWTTQGPGLANHTTGKLSIGPVARSIAQVNTNNLTAVSNNADPGATI